MKVKVSINFIWNQKQKKGSAIVTWANGKKDEQKFKSFFSIQFFVGPILPILPSSDFFKQQLEYFDSLKLTQIDQKV